MALIYDMRRLATVICHEDSHFVILSKDEFTKILKKSEEQKLKNNIEFLTTMPILKGLSLIQIQDISLSSSI